MAFNFNQITKAVKIANGVANPKQAVNMLLEQLEKKNPEMARNVRTAISSGKNPAQYIREQAQNGTITMENFNEVKRYYKMAQKFGLTHKISNQSWNEIEQAIKDKGGAGGFKFNGF